VAIQRVIVYRVDSLHVLFRSSLGELIFLKLFDGIQRAIMACTLTALVAFNLNVEILKPHQVF